MSKPDDWKHMKKKDRKNMLHFMRLQKMQNPQHGPPDPAAFDPKVDYKKEFQKAYREHPRSQKTDPSQMGIAGRNVRIFE